VSELANFIHTLRTELTHQLRLADSYEKLAIQAVLTAVERAAQQALPISQQADLEDRS
jgi:hypothetical protein